MKLKKESKFNVEDLKELDVLVLGSPYKIIFKNYNEEPDFKRLNASGFCDMSTRTISICIIDSYPEYTEMSLFAKSNTYKEILRHELVHAFLYESGLNNDSHGTGDNSWAVDEEIVDWIAIQSPKIFNIYDELGILK